MPHPQSNLTKMQRRALASPAARAKPKDQVTLPKMPFLDKDKKKNESDDYHYSTGEPLNKKKKKNEAYKEPQGQAKRLMSPLQKIRQDKEKADRDRDGKLKEGYEGEVSSHLKALDIDHHWKDGHLHVHKRDHKDVKKRLSDTDMEMPKIKVHEEKGRGPTGIAYSLPKGHPDAENPATRKKYPERQTPEYKKKFFGKDKSSPSSTGMKEETINESINFKGTPHISLTRYSAQGGFGLQLTQNKRMGNEKFRMGAHVSMPMKDVPKLITALQKVMKAPKNAQLGDDD